MFYLDIIAIVSRDLEVRFGIGDSLSSIVESRKEGSVEKIIAGEAVMSYRLRLLPAVSHSGHNFTGDSRGAVYSPWITERGRDENRKKIRSPSSFSRLQNELFTGLETTLVSNPK